MGWTRKVGREQAAAAPPRSPLLERIQAHLGAEATQHPVIAEEYDAFEHPNVQVALEAYLAEGVGDGRFMRRGDSAHFPPEFAGLHDAMVKLTA